MRLRHVSLAAAAALALTPGTVAARARHTIFSSRHLWATIDVCNSAKHPDVVGVRGSMPGTGRRDERMYMRFRLQYQPSPAAAWAYTQADTGFRLVGSASFKARQAGTDFPVVVAPGQKYVLRGVVTFEWRRGAHVVIHAQKATTSGHMSVAGADPPGYSAAACMIG